MVVFIGLLIFVMTGDSNAGLPPTSSSYTITVQQSLREKLTNAETGQVTLTPRRFSHQTTLIWLHDYGQNAKDQVKNFISSRELRVRRSSFGGFVGVGAGSGSGGRGRGGRGRGLQRSRWSRMRDTFKPFVLNNTKIVIP